ncbi:hypothetical protein [Oceanobacillus sp. Castelsardo]|nr:hypothetical protein [Oceanobacillus sp. Castelsardo]
MTEENNGNKEKSGEPTLEELLAKCTDESRHEEYFSRPMGKELL